MKKIVLIAPLLFLFNSLNAQESVVNKYGKEVTVNSPATTTTQGQVKLAGDLGGTGTSADAPIISNGAITPTKIASGGNNKVLVTDSTGAVAWIDAAAFGAVADMTTIEGLGTTASPFKVKDLGITTAKLNNGAVTNAKIGETITVPNGGTGATTLTGYVKGNGTSAMTAVTAIPVADVTGAQTTANLSSSITTDTGSTTKYPSVAAIQSYVTATSGTPFYKTGTTTDIFNSKADNFYTLKNIGIGTDTPSVPLEVQSSAITTNTVSKFLSPNNTTAGNKTLLNMGVATTTGNSAELRYYHAGDNYISNRVDFGFSGITAPAITYIKTGLVGIGTTAPASKLEVSSSEGKTDTVVNISIFNPSTPASNNFAGIQFKSNNDATSAKGSWKIGSNQETTTSSDQNFHFLNSSSGAAYATRMVLTPAGNVGIGTTTPNTKLEINSGTAGTSGLRFTNLTSAATPSASSNYLSLDASGNVIYASNGTSLPLITANGVNSSTTEVRDYNVWANRGNGFYITDNGGAITNQIPNVGAWFSLSQVAKGANYFGQTALNDQGFWFRGGNITSISSNTWRKTLSLNATSKFEVQWDDTTNNTINLNNMDNGPLLLSTNNSEKMRIAPGGNVGIGTTAPAEKLDVAGNVKFSGTLIANNSAGTAGQVLTSTGGTTAPTWAAPSGIASITGTAPINVTTGNTPTISLNTSGVTAGTYTSVTVNAQGLVTGATNPASSVSTSLSGNTLSTTVNGTTATSTTVSGVSNSSTTNSLTTTVNGITGTAVNIINSNTLTATNGQLTSTVNGVSTTPAVSVLTSATNGLTATNGAVGLGGTLSAASTIVTTATNTLALTGLQAGATTDEMLVVNASGVLKKVAASTANAITTKSAAYTALATDETILVNATTAAVTITLPSAPITGKKYYVKKIDTSSNAVTMTAPSGITIDGLSSISGTLPYQGWLVQYDGANWFIISRI